METKYFCETSAWDLMVSLASSNSPQNISTCCSALDKLMGGGFPLGHVTEIAGGASCGKTQICLQACVNVQLPALVGGMGGEAVFLDSECTFVPSRIVDMATSLSKHFGFDKNDGDVSSQFAVDNIMSHVYYHRILNQSQLLSVIASLDHMVQSKRQIKLIVVDSIAAPLRHEFEDYKYRSELLAHIGALLTCLASKYSLAVVVTNQMTAKLNGSNENATEVPSLGKAWASVPAVQLVIGRGLRSPNEGLNNGSNSTIRWAKLVKLANPPLSSPEEICHFQISRDGIRDVDGSC